MKTKKRILHDMATGKQIISSYSEVEIKKSAQFKNIYFMVIGGDLVASATTKLVGSSFLRMFGIIDDKAGLIITSINILNDFRSVKKLEQTFVKNIDRRRDSAEFDRDKYILCDNETKLLNQYKQIGFDVVGDANKQNKRLLKVVDEPWIIKADQLSKCLSKS